MVFDLATQGNLFSLLKKKGKFDESSTLKVKLPIKFCKSFKQRHSMQNKS